MPCPGDIYSEVAILDLHASSIGAGMEPQNGLEVTLNSPVFPCLPEYEFFISTGQCKGSNFLRPGNVYESRGIYKRVAQSRNIDEDSFSDK